VIVCDGILLRESMWSLQNTEDVTLKCGIGEQFDALWQVLTNVEAAGTLAVIPVVAVPIRAVARTSRWAAATAEFSAADVLPTVDDAVWSTAGAAEVRSTSLLRRHAESLHKKAPRSLRRGSVQLVVVADVPVW
jgi:hypothetical protein